MNDRPATTMTPVSENEGGRLIGGPLFRKYVGLFLAVVCVALLSNGLFEIFFSYREHTEALVRIQREQAEGAAEKIGSFIKEIENQMGWTTQLTWSAATTEQRRFDGLRLLRQVPAITELAQLDPEGKEQLRVSRLVMDQGSEKPDLSKDPKFSQAVAKRVYFGPVYFRRDSEPYMTLSVAGTRRDAGVSVAEVNLKLIWDVVSQITVGEHGQAYVIDSDGRLIAHPDISLVLRNTDMTKLAQVRAAREGSGEVGAGGAGYPRRQSAHCLRARHAAGMEGLRRATRRGGLCFTLRLDQTHGRDHSGWPLTGVFIRPVPRAPYGRSDPNVAGRCPAHRWWRPRPAHFNQNRRRARRTGRSVQ